MVELQTVGSARSGARPPRRRAHSGRLGVVLAVVAVLGLSACQANEPSVSAPTTSTPAVTTPPADDAVISTDPPLGATDIDPVTPLVVNAGNGALTDVTVTTDDGTSLAGALSADATSWTASQPLAYGTTYSVSAAARNADGKDAQAAGSVSTVTPRTLTMATVFPNDSNSVVGVGQPITVTFDEDITDRAAVERALHVTTTPAVAGAWSWFDDRSVHFRPQEFWPAHTHVVVDVDVYGLDVGDGISGQADVHQEFDIGDKKVGIVDADEDVLRLYVNDALVNTMPTSLGKDATPTPSGTYVVMQQSRRYTMDSSTYGVDVDEAGGYRTEVEYASRLSNSGIFVHAAPWSVGDQGRRNVSHGCLNVSTANAGWFYDNFGRGDVVQVSNAGPVLQQWDGFGDWNTSWADWLAGSALPQTTA